MNIPVGVSFTIGFFVSILYGIIYDSPRIGLLITFIIAITKEFNDQFVYNKYEWTTTVSSMCGATVAYMILNILSFL